MRLNLCAVHLLLLLTSLTTWSSARSFASSQCVEAAPLWLPLDGLEERFVKKWQRPLSFSIISRGSDSATVQLIKERLLFISQKTNLTLLSKDQSEKSSAPDFLIVVVPDLSRNASLLREIAVRFFQDRLVGGQINIDQSSWVNKLENASPRCLGVDLQVNGSITQAFVIIQENEDASCIGAGLFRSFGLIGIRNFYLRNGSKIPDSIAEAAFRGLYAKSVRPGMNHSEATARLEEACK